MKLELSNELVRLFRLRLRSWADGNRSAPSTRSSIGSQWLPWIWTQSKCPNRIRQFAVQFSTLDDESTHLPKSRRQSPCHLFQTFGLGYSVCSQAQ